MTAPLYPYQYHPKNGDISSGWHVEYSPENPSYIVASIASVLGFSPADSGYSTDGGYSWTPFAAIPLNSTHAVTMFGAGSIHVSAPGHMLWVGAYGHGTYRTTNHGSSWTAVSIPGVTMASLNNQAHYFYRRPITAEKTAGYAGTFYAHAPDVGVFKSTDDGATWTQQCDNRYFSNSPTYGQLYVNYSQNARLKSTPGYPGHLFLTAGQQGTTESPGLNQPFMRSTDGGTTWTQVPTIRSVFGFDFGKAAVGQSYPAIYAMGVVNSVVGMYRSIDNAATWQLLSPQPMQTVAFLREVAASKDTYGLHWISAAGLGVIRGQIA